MESDLPPSDTSTLDSGPHRTSTASPIPGHPPRPVTAFRAYLDLFAVGVLTLFVELALIRWLATEVRVFAYFKNLTLIACFFGGGLGCLIGARMRARRSLYYPALLLIVGLVAAPGLFGWDLIGVVNRFLSGLNDMPLWSFGAGQLHLLTGVLGLAFLVAAFLLITFVFVPVGQLLGCRLGQPPDRLRAYSANIVGSLTGVGLFDLASYLSLPPTVWFLVAAALGLILIETRRDLWMAIATTVVVIALLAVHATRAGGVTVWSPYQKLTLIPDQAVSSSGEKVLIGYTLQVNTILYQKVANLDRGFLLAHPDLFPEAADAAWLGYDLAYRLKERPADVLVVGAGTGNDVAAALRSGAGHVDAVEIDPRIVELGRQYHPERPYSDPRVRVVVDDARSFIKRTDRTYDLIVYGALDSHTQNSAMSNLRVDNYVYTVEAFREARSRLKPDGVLWLLFAIERPHVGERLYTMLAEAFDRPPIVFNNADVARFSPAGGGTTYAIDRDGRIAQLAGASPLLASIINRSRVTPVTNPVPATDDWPYLYVQKRAIPNLYLIVMGLIVLVALILVRPYIGHLRSVDPPFFLLGAAFLLLEVQSVTRMALVFGNTWEVAAIVISSVLVMILLANLLAARLPDRLLFAAYAGLAVSLVTSYLLPTRALLSLEGVTRLSVAGLVVGLPLFFAAIVFALSFRSVAHPGLALGSNLLGAIVGGACESASFIVGLNALALIALLFYLGSFAFQLSARSMTRLPRAGA